MAFPERPPRGPNPDSNAEQRKARAKTVAEIALRILNGPSRAVSNILSSRALPIVIGVGLFGFCIKASGDTFQGAAIGTTAGTISGLITRGFQQGPPDH